MWAKLTENHFLEEIALDIKKYYHASRNTLQQQSTDIYIYILEI